MCGYTHMSASSYEARKGPQIHLERELQVVESYPTQVLGLEGVSQE